MTRKRVHDSACVLSTVCLFVWWTCQLGSCLRIVVKRRRVVTHPDCTHTRIAHTQGFAAHADDALTVCKQEHNQSTHAWHVPATLGHLQSVVQVVQVIQAIHIVTVRSKATRVPQRPRTPPISHPGHPGHPSHPNRHRPLQGTATRLPQRQPQP